MKRGRNNHQRRRQGPNINRALDSNGPDVRIRGTANQIYDKYLALARDANSSGDRVKAENYLQHAEHYFRIIKAMAPQQAPGSEFGDTDGDQPMIGDQEADRFSDSREQRQPEQQNAPQRQDGGDGEGFDEQPDVPDQNMNGAGEGQPQQQQGQQGFNNDQDREGRRRRRRPRRYPREGGEGGQGGQSEPQGETQGGDNEPTDVAAE
jgi:hypothetical protein